MPNKNEINTIMENIEINLTAEQKLRKYFAGMCVRKDSSLEQFAILSIPSFIRDWFIRKYSDDDGRLNASFVSQEIRRVIPRRSEWSALLDKMMSEGKQVKFIGKIDIKRDVKSGQITFELPDLGLEYKDTRVPSEVWNNCKEPFLAANGAIWGIITLYYSTETVNHKSLGTVLLKDFKDFKPYKTNITYYKKARECFDTSEWIDVLLGAIDYNADGFGTEDEKLALLTRLLPFCEKRLNLIELAPKGTGKSYLFSKISKRGWLASGGVMTRAKMFYDMNLRQQGLVANYDYVALDEISTIRFGDINEMQGALKGYLESGVYTVGNTEGKGDAGVVLLGNIDKSEMNIEHKMFVTLPDVFQDSALIDRFHGFIEGWRIPRMSEDKKICGWALNTEYFAEILHELREDLAARSVVDALLEIESGADTRDVTAVKRIASAYVKLLFPNWNCVDNVNTEEFEKYCLTPAINMRSIIKKQLGLMDSEFSGKKMPEITIKKKEIL